MVWRGRGGSDRRVPDGGAAPASVAYPMWVGLGAVGTVVLGVTLLGESLDPVKVAALHASE